MISPKGSEKNKARSTNISTKPILINKTNNISNFNNNDKPPIQKVKSIDRDIFNPGSSPLNNSFMEKLNIRCLTY